MDYDLKWLHNHLRRLIGAGPRIRFPGPLTYDNTRDAYLHKWPEWFKMDLEMLAKLTSPDLMIEIDNGGRAEAQTVVDQCLASRHRVATFYSGPDGFSDDIHRME